MRVNVQTVTDGEGVPSAPEIIEWASRALRLGPHEAEITVRIVDLEEARNLNEKWRGGAGPTNVLAFPIEGLKVEHRLLGDVVVCGPIANEEAARDGKLASAHWAHLVIHGTLHLLGYDHLNDTDAAQMEAVERTLLGELGYPDPYI